MFVSQMGKCDSNGNGMGKVDWKVENLSFVFGDFGRNWLHLPNPPNTVHNADRELHVIAETKLKLLIVVNTWLPYLHSIIHYKHNATNTNDYCFGFNANLPFSEKGKKYKKKCIANIV